MGKSIRRIIKEEISSFNFLNSEDHQQYDEYITILNNQDLQKQFVSDLINGRNVEKDDEYLTDVKGDLDDELGSKTISFEYETDVVYTYGGSKPIKFQIHINANNINAYLGGSEDKGDYLTAPYSESSFTEMDWEDMEVKMYSDDGDEIEFRAYEELPVDAKESFIKSFISKPFVERISIAIE